MDANIPSEQGVACINGEFMPLAEARVPALDRGFIFGDGVYEVIPVYARRPFRLEGHLQRLERSLDGIRLPNPHTRAQWGALIEELARRGPSEDQSLYLQVTRGVAKRDHAFPKDTKPTVFMMTNPLVPPEPGLVSEGVSAVSAADNRWLRCDLKTIALLPNVLLRQLAVDAGAAEVVLLRDGFLLAPPKSNLILAGITYDVILELALAGKIPSEVRAISEAEVRAADEVWLTSSTREVLAITKLDGKTVGEGRPGPVFRRMYALFQELKAGLRHPGTRAHA
jgi:D-alanine transaminase